MLSSFKNHALEVVLTGPLCGHGPVSCWLSCYCVNCAMFHVFLAQTWVCMHAPHFFIVHLVVMAALLRGSRYATGAHRDQPLTSLQCPPLPQQTTIRTRYCELGGRSSAPPWSVAHLTACEGQPHQPQNMSLPPNTRTQLAAVLNRTIVWLSSAKILDDSYAYKYLNKHSFVYFPTQSMRQK